MIHTVGIAEMRFSNSAEDEIVTHALGSCLGIVVYDPVAMVGGMLHVMLPLSTIDPMKARANPSMFVDTGVPKLFMESYKWGAKKERLIVSVAGGAAVGSSERGDFFEIGKRNMIMLRKLLWKNGVILKASDVGGSVSRQMRLMMRDGRVLVRVEGTENVLVPPSAAEKMRAACASGAPPAAALAGEEPGATVGGNGGTVGTGGRPVAAGPGVARPILPSSATLGGLRPSTDPRG